MQASKIVTRWLEVSYLRFPAWQKALSGLHASKNAL